MDVKLDKNYTDADERAARHKQKATKYSDGEVLGIIDSALVSIDRDSDAPWSQAYSQLAQAMIAYNNMVDERWRK